LVGAVVGAVSVALAAGPAGAGDSSLQAALQEAIAADVASDPAIPGEILTVRAPGIDETVATGFADVDAQTPLEPDTPFRVASMTKTVVAAAVLRLVEEGKLRLADPITEHLSPESLDVLRADGYDVDGITVRQLLQHTAGLYDYAADPEYEARSVTDPTHRWTRLEQLQLATELGDPLGAPGEVFNYSDTGYILLGEILERTTGDTLPEAVRELVHFDRLGLDDTYWEILEDKPAGYADRAHQYYGTDIDNIGFDASQDLYGGGGLVSTTGDLARFYEALFGGEVFEKPSTLKTMTKVSRAGRDDQAGMGIYVVDAAGERCFGHRGFWGTQTIHCPRLDLTFARTINQALDQGFDDDALEQVIVEAVTR
jgi:D-alanyl-D-alanine carboxypeptidase